MTSHTAILLFGRSAFAEARHKDFGDAKLGRGIAASLIRRTRDTILRTGLPLLHADERKQCGTTFGERLTNAMSAAYARGYEHLIVVGNDCPGLRSGQLLRAAEQLAAGHTVIGPDRRGGIWLLGLSRDRFRRADLLTVRWCSPDACMDLRQHMREVHELPSLADANAVRDLLRHRKQWSRVIGGIYVLLAPGHSPHIDLTYWTDSRVGDSSCGRAPPQAA